MGTIITDKATGAHHGLVLFPETTIYAEAETIEILEEMIEILVKVFIIDHLISTVDCHLKMMIKDQWSSTNEKKVEECIMLITVLMESAVMLHLGRKGEARIDGIGNIESTVKTKSIVGIKALEKTTVNEAYPEPETMIGGSMVRRDTQMKDAMVTTTETTNETEIAKVTKKMVWKKGGSTEEREVEIGISIAKIANIREDIVVGVEATVEVTAIGGGGTGVMIVKVEIIIGDEVIAAMFIETNHLITTTTGSEVGMILRIDILF
jgi:hypothetical protein